MADVTLKALLLGDDRSAAAALKSVAREVDKVAERLVALSRLDATPEVKIRTAEAQAELARLQAEMKALGAESEKTGKKGEAAGKQIGAMTTAIVGLGPALVPLAAGATALAAGWGAMGAAGVLAFVGVRKEMQQGTALGVEFSAGVTTIKGDIQQLGHVAAAGVLAPFQRSISDLQGKMPALTTMIGQFSTVTGQAGANVTHGLVSAFIALAPLERDVAAYTLALSQRFDALMSGQGVVAFGDYVRSVFPQVMADVESIVTAAGHLVAGFAPLGTGVLSELRLFSDLISAIPLPVLQTLATLGGSVFLGFATWQRLSPIVGKVAGALDMLKVSEEGVAAATRTMNIAFGVVGVLVAGFSMLMSANAEATRQNQQAANDYADALQRSNGVIDESIRQMTAKKLADEGVLDAARNLGYNLTDVTNAALGNADAMARVQTHTDAVRGSFADANAAGADLSATYGNVGGDIDKVTGAVSGNNTALQAGIQKYKDLKAATQDAGGASSSAAIAAQNLATAYGTSVANYQAAATGQQGIADKAAQATVKMQMENDAAGILKQSLDALNGKTLSAADAQNAFDSSLVNMGDHVDKTGKKIHFTTTNIGDMSAASVALRGQLNGQVQNLERVVEANGGLSNSTSKARAQMMSMRKQIIDNAVAHGIDRAAVTAYIDKVLKIPKKVPPTKTDIDKAAAEAKLRSFQAHVNGLHGKTVTITTLLNTISFVTKGDTSYQAAKNRSELANSRAMGGPVPGYAGGTIIGPGTGTSDSVLAMNGLTGALLSVSSGEFISTASSTSRNQRALEAGNRGARLAVAGVGGSGGGDINLTVQLRTPTGQLIHQELLRLKRTQGGQPLGLD